MSASSVDGELTRLHALLVGPLCATLPDKGQRIREKIARLEQQRLHQAQQHAAGTDDSKYEQRPVALTPAPSSAAVTDTATSAVASVSSAFALDAAAVSQLQRYQAHAHVPSNSSRSRFIAASERVVVEREVEEDALASLLSALSLNAASADAAGRANSEIVTSTVSTPLFPHQLSAVAWMRAREADADPSGGLLADDCGLGKTLTVIALVATQQQNAEHRGVTLIVCPRGLVSQWQREIRTHCAPDALRVFAHQGAKSSDRTRADLEAFDVILASYESVRSESAKPGSALMSVDYVRVVLDEAHRIRNSRALQTQSVCQLSARHRWLLTATPIHNHLDDLRSAFVFLRHAPYDDAATWKRLIHCKDQHGIERARTLLRATMLRRTKNDIDPVTQQPLVKLTPKIVELHHLPLTPIERAFYDRLHALCRQRAKSLTSSYAAMLAMLVRLRQCCDHFVLTIHRQEQQEESPTWTATLQAAQHVGLALDEHFAGTLDEDSYQTAIVENSPPPRVPPTLSQCLVDSSKIAKILELLTRIEAVGPDDKCVIFSQFTRYLDLIEKVFAARGLTPPARFDGSQKGDEQQRQLEHFDSSPPSECRVLLVSLTAGGVGLNLTRANHAIICDLWWNPALEVQCMDRIHRLSQPKPVFVHRLCAADTVEMELLEMQRTKQHIADAAMQQRSVKNAADDDDNAAGQPEAALSLASLRRLFHLHHVSGERG